MARGVENASGRASYLKLEILHEASGVLIVPAICCFPCTVHMFEQSAHHGSVLRISHWQLNVSWVVWVSGCTEVSPADGYEGQLRPVLAVGVSVVSQHLGDGRGC